MSESKSGFEGERIAKAIARAGVCSRRDAEAMILAGRVSVNGKKLTSPALNVTVGDDIRIDGKPMPEPERTRLFRYYKPRGLVTTAKDPQGRPTVFDSLPKGMPRVVSVGRLDLNSEGLLLLTNDGGLARRLELPTTGWVRRYRVRVHGEVDQTQLGQLAKGITVEGVRYGAIEATLDRKQGDNVWLTMALTEGKNREIRKICGHFGWPVSRLIRVAYGPFQLGSQLNPGDIEEVPAKVLREQLGEKKPVHKVGGQLRLKDAAPQADRPRPAAPRPAQRQKPPLKPRRHAH
jgi:23S rRNA pseudouridine2605 synthase